MQMEGPVLTYCWSRFCFKVTYFPADFLLMMLFFLMPPWRASAFLDIGSLFGATVESMD